LISLPNIKSESGITLKYGKDFKQKKYQLFELGSDPEII